MEGETLGALAAAWATKQAWAPGTEKRERYLLAQWTPKLGDIPARARQAARCATWPPGRRDLLGRYEHARLALPRPARKPCRALRGFGERQLAAHVQVRGQGCRAGRLSGLSLTETPMTRMNNPPHPGAVLADTVLRKNGGITVTEFAKRLRVSRVALSRVVNGRAAVSAELAIRLAAALGGSAESWLNMQTAYDLWHAEKKRRPKIAPIREATV